VLASIGPDQQSYQTLNPPTVILNKSAPAGREHENLIFGASSVGISRGVLDIVAEGLIEADQESIVLVSLWVDAAASDETVVCQNARVATAAAVREAVLGRDVAAAKDLVKHRETIRHPFYGGK
jgi:formaldehyde-activating enzyme